MSIELDEDERREVRRKARAAILDAIKSLGGEGVRPEILARAISKGRFTSRELAAAAPDKARGQYQCFVEYQLSWALTNLKRDGFLENPRWSVWRLAGVSAEESPSPSPTRIPAPRLAELRAMPYSQYLRTSEWRKTRAAALARAGHRCSMDRSHSGDLEVHHNTYERVGAERPEDLVVLCRDCHLLHHEHNGRPRRPKTEEQARRLREAASIAPPTLGPDLSKPVAARDKPSLLRRIVGRT